MKRFLAVLLFLLPLPVQAAVAVVDVCTAAGATSTSLTYSCTVTAGATVLIVGVSTRRNVSAIDNAVTYNGVSMTSWGYIQNGSQSHLELWYMASPPSGAHNVVITPGASTQIVSDGISFSGTSITTPIRQGTTFTWVSGQPTATLSGTLAGNVILDVAMALENATGWTAGTNQTQRWAASIGSAGSTRIWNSASTKGTTGNCATPAPYDFPGCTVTMDETVTTQPGFSIMFTVEVSIDEPPLADSRLDKYGGVADVSCTPTRTPTTYTISNVARTGGVATITLSATADPVNWQYQPIIISGVSTDSGSFNTVATDIAPIASVPSGTTFTISNAGSDVASVAASGTATYAHWDTCQVARSNGELDWYARTPLGHPMKLMYIQSIDAADTTADVNGVKKSNTINAKYAVGPDGAGNFQWNAYIQVMRNMQLWGFNTLGEYAQTRTRPTATDWHQGDGHPPVQVRMPFIFFTASVLGTTVRGSAGLGRGKFLGPTYKNRYHSSTWSACSQVMTGDPLDSRFDGSVAWQFQRASHRADQHLAKYNDYMIGLFSDESDDIGMSRPGRDFCPYNSGAADSPCGISAGPNVGLQALVSSPIMVTLPDTGFFDSSGLGSNRHSTCGDVFAVTGDVLYSGASDDTTFQMKADLLSWLQGTLDSTSAVTATRSAGVVTYTKASHPFINKELITVKSCSDSTFNTVLGTGVVLTAATSSTFTATLAGAGTSATGCVVTTGPGYANIAALNDAAKWNSSYTQFNSTGTTVSSESLGTGDGTTTVFSGTFAHAPSPQTMFIKLDGTPECGDDAANMLDRVTYAEAGAFRVGCWTNTTSEAAKALLTGVSVSRTSNVVVATKTSHGLSIGTTINAVTGCTAGFRLTQRAQITATTSNTFTYPDVGSDGTDTGCSVDAGGHPSPTSVAVTRLANVVTATKTAHGLAVGMAINAIESCSPSTFNTTTRVVITAVPTADTFVYTHAGANGSGTGCTFRLSFSTVNYTTGAYTLKFNAAPESGQAITASYTYGGWGTGTGVADEDGRGAWMPTNQYAMTGPNTAAFTTDMDNFIFHISKNYHRALRTNGDAYLPGRLQMGIINISGYCAPSQAPIFQAMKPYLDIIGMSNNWCGNVSGDAADRIDYIGLNSGDMPFVVWNGYTAVSDSPYTTGTNSAATPACCSNQSTRSTRYSDNISEQLAAKNSLTGVHPFLGNGWWNYWDQRSETQNWGLVTNRDNPYDGRANVTSYGTFGYPRQCYNDGNLSTATICDKGPFNNFLTGVIRANNLWLDNLTRIRAQGKR